MSGQRNEGWHATKVLSWTQTGDIAVHDLHVKPHWDDLRLTFFPINYSLISFRVINSESTVFAVLQ